jgi:hypothetical protein
MEFVNGRRGAPVEKMGQGVQSFNPKLSGHVSMKKNSTHDVVGRPYEALCLTVLGRGART